MTPDDLLAFRAIEELKYRFLRTLDLKDWNGFAEMFEPDATAEYGEGLRFADAAEHRILIEGGAVYRDSYRRGADGQWRVSHTGYERIYESTMSLDDWPSWQCTTSRSRPRLTRVADS